MDACWNVFWKNNSFDWDSLWAHSFLLIPYLAWLYSHVHWSHSDVDFGLEWTSNGDSPAFFASGLSSLCAVCRFCCDSPWGNSFHCYPNWIQLCFHAHWSHFGLHLVENGQAMVIPSLFPWWQPHRDIDRFGPSAVCCSAKHLSLLPWRLTASVRGTKSMHQPAWRACW